MPLPYCDITTSDFDTVWPDIATVLGHFQNHTLTRKSTERYIKMLLNCYKPDENNPLLFYRYDPTLYKGSRIFKDLQRNGLDRDFCAQSALRKFVISNTGDQERGGLDTEVKCLFWHEDTKSPPSRKMKLFCFPAHLYLDENETAGRKLAREKTLEKLGLPHITGTINPISALCCDENTELEIIFYNEFPERTHNNSGTRLFGTTFPSMQRLIEGITQYAKNNCPKITVTTREIALRTTRNKDDDPGEAAAAIEAHEAIRQKLTNTTFSPPPPNKQNLRTICCGGK
jgi:hypothetical protein